MKRHWSFALVEELKAIDAEEGPHGLYGLRESRRTGDRLPKLIPILEAPPIRLIRRIGAAQHTGSPSATYISFGVDHQRTVLVDLEDYADTKVRKFGSTYRLDKQSDVPARNTPDFGTLLPRLAKRVSENHGNMTFSFGLLFIGHFAKQKDLHSFLDPFTGDEYLLRYGLGQAGDSWSDAHGRDFFTAIRIWYVEQKPA